MRRDSKPAPGWQEPAKREAIEVQLQLITPMFGGGYKTREVDPLMPIRPAAIRGHLRFWWRATAGARYTNAEELYKAETAIWGGATKDGEPVWGKVAIHVEVERKGTLKKCAEYEWDQSRNRYKAMPKFLHGWPAYALHPFQGKAEEDKISQEPAEGLCDTRFRVVVSHDSSVERTELVTALAAWIRYGGVGARTRRGCGSIVSLSTLSVDFTDLPVLEEPQFTVLKGSRYVLGSPMKDAVEAWREAVELYQHFRQGRGFARQKQSLRNSNRPGRSFWPEADSIRRITQNWYPQHKPMHKVEYGFPRADLGLPIVFHFLDSSQGDPKDVVLQRASKTATRMASPVITKAIQTDTNEYRPLILVLNAPHAWSGGEITLSYVDGGKILRRVSRPEVELNRQQRDQIQPLKNKKNKENNESQPIREALLEFASQRWNSEVEVI